MPIAIAHTSILLSLIIVNEIVKTNHLQLIFDTFFMPHAASRLPEASHFSACRRVPATSEPPAPPGQAASPAAAGPHPTGLHAAERGHLGGEGGLVS